jgi:hypothetical protein
MRPVKKVVGPKQDNYFRGIIFCKKCGSKMVMQMTGKHPAYVCGKKDSYGKEACVMPYIHKDYVYETVHRVLGEQMQLLLDADKVLRQINSSEKMDSYLQSVKKSICDTEKRIDRLMKMKTSAYQDLAEGLLNESEYRTINAEYDESIREFEQETATLREKLIGSETTPFDEYSGREEMIRLKNSKKLSQELVDALVDKIILYEDQSVEVVLKFDDVLKGTICQQEMKEALING